MSNDLEKRLITQLDTQQNNELDRYVNATRDELNALTNSILVEICKHFRLPHSGRNKDDLITQILKVPM